MDRWNRDRRERRDASTGRSPNRARRASGSSESPASIHRYRSDQLCPHAQHSSPGVSPKRTPGGSTSGTPLLQSPSLKRGQAKALSTGKSKKDQYFIPDQLSSSPKRGTASQGSSSNLLSPNVRRKIMMDLRDDASGEATVEEWYRKNGIGPEMLVDMPLVRKIYMNNIHREVGKEMMQKSQDPKEDIQDDMESDELLQRARSNSRRFSSFLSPEAQLASLNMYEGGNDNYSDNEGEAAGEKAMDQDTVVQPMDPEELSVRLQKAMDIKDNSRQDK